MCPPGWHLHRNCPAAGNCLPEATTVGCCLQVQTIRKRTPSMLDGLSAMGAAPLTSASSVCAIAAQQRGGAAAAANHASIHLPGAAAECALHHRHSPSVAR